VKCEGQRARAPTHQVSAPLATIVRLDNGNQVSAQITAVKVTLPLHAFALSKVSVPAKPVKLVLVPLPLHD
jgi:hypothetical protein